MHIRKALAEIRTDHLPLTMKAKHIVLTPTPDVLTLSLFVCYVSIWKVLATIWLYKIGKRRG